MRSCTDKINHLQGHKLVPNCLFELLNTSKHEEKQFSPKIQKGKLHVLCSLLQYALCSSAAWHTLHFSVPLPTIRTPAAQHPGFHIKFSKLHSKHMHFCIFLYTSAGSNSSRHFEWVLTVTSSAAPQKGHRSTENHQPQAQGCSALLTPSFCTNPRASSFPSPRPSMPCAHVQAGCAADSKQPMPLSAIPKKAQCSQATHHNQASVSSPSPSWS